MSKNDDLGDRMKDYEQRETSRRFMKFAPVIARMDGRGFSQWTKGLDRPYDKRLSDVMIAVTQRLVAGTGARIGYTQSDEISLVFLVEEIKQELMFDGKAQKLCSILASMTTAFFIDECLKAGGELAKRLSSLPNFDARVFQVPTRFEAANAILWREKDACKNAVSMAARSFYPHRVLQGKTSAEMQEMMFAKGQNFNDYPDFFKRGSFIQARRHEQFLGEKEIAALRKMRVQGTFFRTKIERIEMPVFSKVSNRESVIFEGADPVTYSEGDAK